jgi:hypothetical protein
MATRTEIVGFRGELLRHGDDGYKQARLWDPHNLFRANQNISPGWRTG